MTRTAPAPRSARTGDARARAADVLVRVETDAAFAAPALAASLDRAPALAPADRALATELVYGVLRTAAALDARLSRYASRPGSLAALDPYTRAVLRIAAYQVLALARVPPRAAVHSAVEALKRDRSPGTAGFANALLRKLTAERPEPLPDDARIELALASVPERVRDTLAAALGSPDEARAFLRAAFARPPGVVLRANAARTDRDALRARLEAELPGARFVPGAVSPLALHVTGGGDVTRAAAFREGLFAVQEEGAQCVALAAGVSPGMAVLDACAGRGGKTTALAAALAGKGTLHAVDLYPEKVARIEPELARLGLREGLAFASAAADLTRGLGALGRAAPAGGYDVAVVDAPCSGLGTLARRPDLLARGADEARAVDDEDDAAPDAARAREGAGPRVPLPELQRAILARVAPLVRPGGVLVYAVCTVSRDEGPGAVAWLRERMPEWEPAQASEGVPERLRPAEVVLRPDTDGTDGFMVFRLRRKTSA